MHYADYAANGIYMLTALADAMGEDINDWLNDDDGTYIIDAIAHLLHVGAEHGHDPRELADRAVATHEGDIEDQQLATPHDGTTVYHGSPTLLPAGTVLVPGPHLRNVYATTSPEQARVWGATKGADVYVYEVQMGDGAVNVGGHIAAPTATIVRLLQDA